MAFFKYLFYKFYKFQLRVGSFIFPEIDAIGMILFSTSMYLFGVMFTCCFLFPNIKLPDRDVFVPGILVFSLGFYIVLYCIFIRKRKYKKILKECEVLYKNSSSIWAILYFTLSFIFLFFPIFLFCARSNAWI